MSRPTPGDDPTQDACAARGIVLARIVRAHGVRGAVRCRLYVEEADALSRAGPVRLSDGRVTRVRVLATDGAHALCELDGVDDRTVAAALVGSELTVPRSRLPVPESGSYYHADLMGLRVRDTADRPQGTVVAVHNFGAGDLLEVKPANQPSIFVPFTSEAVPVVDLAGGFLRADARWFATETASDHPPATAGMQHDDT